MNTVAPPRSSGVAIYESLVFASIVAKISRLGNNSRSGKHLVSYLFGDLVGGVIGSDDEVKIGETVDLLAFVEESFGLRLIAGERTLFAGKGDIQPAVLEARIEPDAGETAVFKHLAVGVDRPGASPEREDTGLGTLKDILECRGFDGSICVDPFRVDYGRDESSFRILDGSIEVGPFAPQAMSEMTCDAGFADTHEAG